jgi:hypothetical protein
LTTPSATASCPSRLAPAIYAQKAERLLAVARILRPHIEASASPRLFAVHDSRILRELCNTREFGLAIGVEGVFGQNCSGILREFMRALSPAQIPAFVSVVRTERAE